MSEGADPKAMDKEFVRRWLARARLPGRRRAARAARRSPLARRRGATSRPTSGSRVGLRAPTPSRRCSASAATSDSRSVFAVLQFPGSNDDRDMVFAMKSVLGADARLSGTRTRSCRRERQCVLAPRAASRTATTCAAARWRASRRSWRRSRALPLRAVRCWAPATASRCSGEAGLLPGALLRQSRSRLRLRAVALACRARGGAVHVARDARAGVADPDQARGRALPRHAGETRASRSRQPGGVALLHAAPATSRTRRIRTARSQRGRRLQRGWQRDGLDAASGARGRSAHGFHDGRVLLGSLIDWAEQQTR